MPRIPLEDPIKPGEPGYNPAITGFYDGLGDALGDYLCNNRNILPTLGSQATPGNAGLGYGLGALAQIPVDLFCGAQPPSGDMLPPSQPFNGGQCAVSYYADVRLYKKDAEYPDGNEYTFANVGLAGPIQVTEQGTTSGPGEVARRLVLIDGNGNEAYSLIYKRVKTVTPPGGEPTKVYGFGSITPLNLRRADGQPDTCGNPPAINPAPTAPAPSNNPVNITIPVTIGPIIINTPVTIGPLIFSPKVGPFQLTIPVNGGPVNINPNFTFSPTNNVSVSVDLTGDTPTYSDKECGTDEAVKRAITDTVSLRILTTNCQEEVLFDTTLTGQPLAVITGGIQLLNTADQERYNTQCQFTPEPVGRFALGSFTAGVLNEVQEVTGINKDAVALEVVVTSRGSNLRYYRQSPNSTLDQGRFGVGSIAPVIDGQGNYLEGQPQYFENGFYLLPEVPCDSFKFRFATTSGVSYTVYDTGLRRK